MPAARVLSSPSGEAAEDNVEERENSEVTQFLGGRGTGTTTDDGRTEEDGRTDDGRTDRIFLSNIVLDKSSNHLARFKNNPLHILIKIQNSIEFHLIHCGSS